MKKNLLKITLIIFLALMIISPIIVSAQSNLPPGYTSLGGGGGVTSSSTSSGGVVFTNTSQPACAGTGLGNLICKTQQILNSIVPLLLALGVVYFVWGVVTYVISSDEEAKKAGRDRIIYGIIGLTVIIGLWGLVNIVVRTFELAQSAPTTQIANLTVAPPPTSGCPAINPGSSKFPDVINYVTCVIGKSIIPLIFAIAVVTFIWGAVKFLIIGVDDEKNREQGKQFMLWGIIALAVMLSVWGLVAIFTNTFGVSGSVLPTVRP